MRWNVSKGPTVILVLWYLSPILVYVSDVRAILFFCVYVLLFCVHVCVFSNLHLYAKWQIEKNNIFSAFKNWPMGDCNIQISEKSRIYQNRIEDIFPTRQN
jgi:hypothetical protein